MSRRITINEKILKKIEFIISDELGLDKINKSKIFFELQSELFVNPPEMWTETERALEEYTSMVSINIFEKIKELLTIKNNKL